MTNGSISISLAAVSDPDGLKASFTDPTEDTTYEGVDFDGAFATSDDATLGVLARTLSITSSAASGNYNVSDPMVATGVYGGEAVTEELQLEDPDGDEVVLGSQPFMFPPGVTLLVPASGGSGALLVGVEDVAAPRGGNFAGFRSHADGNVVIASRGGVEDTIPAKTAVREDVRFSSLKRATATGVTLYADVETRGQ